jgi:hypothetical protein
MNVRTAFPLIICAFVSLLLTQAAYAQMSSTNYRIDWDVINSGGDSSSSSASYLLRDSIGGMSEGNSTSTTYSFDAGYRGGVYDRVVDFDVFLQDTASQVGATVLSGTTVTIASTSGYAADDMVVIIQDEGSGQSAAVGKVNSVGAGTLVLDVLSGDSLTIDGTNDVVYQLDATSLSFGSLSSSAVSTAIVAWEATGDVDSGYDVYLVEDQAMTDGVNSIADVSDGTVTAGSSEYGARASDTTIASSTFDTEDTAITSTLTAVGTQATTTFTSRDFLTLKMAISSSQPDGGYSHTLTLLYVGNY